MITEFEGRVSEFGGPFDLGVTPDEGLSFIQPVDLKDWWFRHLFLEEQPPGTTGLARRLNPAAYYIACRWSQTDPEWKRKIRYSVAKVFAPSTGRMVICRPADWGPHTRTKRVADMSKGALSRLQIKTDDIVQVRLFYL